MIIENRRTARIFKAFGDENRLMILKLLQHEEKCACKLLEALNIGQPTLSHHMQILCDAGVVNARKEGKWTHYSLDREGCEQAVRLLVEMLDPCFAKNQSNCEKACHIVQNDKMAEEG